MVLCGPQLSMRGECYLLIYAVMQAAHFPLILCFFLLPCVEFILLQQRTELLSFHPVFLHSVFKNSIAALLLGGRLSTEYTSSFHLFTHMCRMCLTVRSGFVWSRADTHISLGSRPQGTPVNSCSSSSGLSQPARQTELPVLQCVRVCVCLSVP